MARAGEGHASFLGGELLGELLQVVEDHIRIPLGTLRRVRTADETGNHPRVARSAHVVILITDVHAAFRLYLHVLCELFQSVRVGLSAAMAEIICGGNSRDTRIQV